MKTDLTPALHEAGKALLSLQGTKLSGAGDKADAGNLIDDLEVIAKVIDKLVLKYGEAAREHLGVTQSELDAMFTDQLARSLEGNGLYIIEAAGKQASEFLEAAE
jgi:hypothetical protein